LPFSMVSPFYVDIITDRRISQTSIPKQVSKCPAHHAHNCAPCGPRLYLPQLYDGTFPVFQFEIRRYYVAQMTINTIIVDDEKPARDELAFLLKSFPEINLIGQGKNGVEAVALIKEHLPDLVFLDVKMPGLDGFGVLKKLVERKMKIPHVVFATAFDQYAVQAFDVSAVDYVLKPFDKGRLAKAINRARKMLETQTSATDRLEQLVNQLESSRQNSSPPAKLLVKSQQRLLLVDAEDFICASIQDGLISVTARDVEGTSNYRTLEELNASLDSDAFWRPHRSFLVNIHHIKEVVPWFKSSYMLKMNDKKQTEIPVSRAQTKRLRELFKL
jgi:two-component system, LytTR family, response regulator LytT